VRSFKGLVSGEYDFLSEQALYMTGNIDEAVARYKAQS
jgi:F0F1-type ATP synthase beta subunit